MRLLMTGASVVALTSCMTTQSFAAEGGAKVETNAQGDVEAIIVTGTRTTGLRAVDSPAPIQVVGSDLLRKTGQPDLIAALAQNMPSIEAQASGGDQAAFHLSFRQRGLGPNQTLTLLNGKRRHGTANIAPAGGAFGGNAAPDVGIIPTGSIDHVEVLSDGAAAQYGSDAIAGVVNIIQKKGGSGGQIVFNGGQYYDVGGRSGQLSANVGITPIENSFLNLTFESNFHDFTFRGDIDPRISPLTSQGRTLLAQFPGLVNEANYPYSNRVIGDAQSRWNTFAFNGGYDISPNLQFYTFGTYTHRFGQAFENYRIPSAVKGVGATDYPFPQGFSPKEKTVQDDYAVTGGFTGENSGWRWDLSSTYGSDTDMVYVLDSTNINLYQTSSTATTPGRSPRNFYDGQFHATEWENTLDLSKDFDVGMAGPMTLAFGGEYRRNTYEIGAGQVEAYTGSGAESFFGYSPKDAGSYSRHNWAIYGDIAIKPLEQLKLDGAVRHEDYSDFGDTTIWKLTGRYDFNPAIAVRGTISTGFRAPSLGEQYYSGINVGPGSIGGRLAPSSAGAALIGFDGLGPEKSKNYALGLVFHPVSRLTSTIDFYKITIQDRITLSGSIYGYDARNRNVVSPSVTAALAVNGVIPNPDFFDKVLYPNATISVASFVNGWDTKNEGFDWVTTYSSDFGDLGAVDWSFSVNYTFAEITRTAGPPRNVTPGVLLFTPTSVNGFKHNAPKWRATFGANWSYHRLTVNLRESFYGSNDSISQWPTSAYPSYAVNGYVRIAQKAAFITDLDVGYRVNDWARISVGANNLFNKYPTLYPADYRQAQLDAISTGYSTPYASAAYGVNGGYYYGKLTLTF
jgi:iron complex outermembrane receptor protein